MLACVVYRAECLFAHRTPLRDNGHRWRLRTQLGHGSNGREGGRCGGHLGGSSGGSCGGRLDWLVRLRSQVLQCVMYFHGSMAAECGQANRTLRGARRHIRCGRRRLFCLFPGFGDFNQSIELNGKANEIRSSTDYVYRRPPAPAVYQLLKKVTHFVGRNMATLAMEIHVPRLRQFGHPFAANAALNDIGRVLLPIMEHGLLLRFKNAAAHFASDHGWRRQRCGLRCCGAGRFVGDRTCVGVLLSGFRNQKHKSHGTSQRGSNCFDGALTSLSDSLISCAEPSSGAAATCRPFQCARNRSIVEKSRAHFGHLTVFCACWLFLCICRLDTDAQLTLHSLHRTIFVHAVAPRM